MFGKLGFLQSCKVLNNIANDENKFNELCQSACKTVLSGIPLPASQNIDESNAMNAIAYLCRSCSQSAPHPTDKEIAVCLNSNTILSRSAIEYFVLTYNSVKESGTVVQTSKVSS